jgi:hypothetical protein
MATNFNLTARPDLTPELKGGKVVFSRKQADEKTVEKRSAPKQESDNQPPTTDAADGAARGEKQSKAK